MKHNNRHVSKTKLLKALKEKGLSLERITKGDKRIWQIDNKVYQNLVEVYDVYMK